MNKFVLAALLFAGLFFNSCERKLSQNDVENELKKAMTNQLYKGIGNDSSKVKYQVVSVNFFEDKGFYECEFKVHMTSNTTDTTGIMAARISKDFSRVARKY
ncbi:MAG: hypothetical protein C5B59_11475 [Bacteroidetes bacterium]|nr:MAG: hypothetical protein C5B59_11475 [Bacteroidota bacterium]